uniref:Uncharacterized protein n=1 Tax=Fagus sylvatica TaxID=28930 RepID=A0A2N9GR10_FAGSY
MDLSMGGAMESFGVCDLGLMSLWVGLRLVVGWEMGWSCGRDTEETDLSFENAEWLLSICVRVDLEPDVQWLTVIFKV